jgi:hypothetical protein
VLVGAGWSRVVFVNLTTNGDTMPTITSNDGTEIFYKDWGTATGWSHMTGAVTAGRSRSAAATTWTTTQTTWPR